MYAQTSLKAHPWCQTLLGLVGRSPASGDDPVPRLMTKSGLVSSVVIENSDRPIKVGLFRKTPPSCNVPRPGMCLGRKYLVRDQVEVAYSLERVDLHWCSRSAPRAVG